MFSTASRTISAVRKPSGWLLRKMAKYFVSQSRKLPGPAASATSAASVPAAAAAAHRRRPARLASTKSPAPTLSSSDRSMPKR